MKNFLKVIIFSLLVLSAYTLVPNTLPQQKSEPPPLEEKVGALTMDQFVAIGADIYSGARGGFGGCVLCHDPKLGRAPNLVNMPTVSDGRLKDARYKGKATNAEEYLRESMLEPAAFVVAGFRVPWFNDNPSARAGLSKGLE